MKFYIRSFEYSLKFPENYLKVIKKYAKNESVNLIKDD